MTDSGTKTPSFTSRIGHVPTQRIAQNIAGFRAGFAALFLLALLFNTAHAAPSIDWSFSLHAGHDDQVYADPERQGVVEPVSEFFGTTRSRLLLRHDDLGRVGDRLELAAEASRTTYGDNVSGNDHGLAASGRYSRWLSKHSILEASLSALRFRREKLSLFDLDQIELGTRVSWIGSEPWLLGVKALHRWPSYRGRYLSENSDRTEKDRQLDLAGSVMREIGDGGYVNVEIGGRWNRSNDPLVEYRGPIVTGRMGFRQVAQFTLMPYVSFGHRAYDSYPVLAMDGEEYVDTGERRTDSTWRTGLGIERPFNRSVKAFADVSLIHQTSNIDALAFDQTRVSIGLQILALSKGDKRRLILPTMDGAEAGASDAIATPLAPRWIDGKVRFRHHAPGAAKVAVVGGWNAWNQGHSPMTGPDPSGIWETTIEVPIGVWRYAIVVDGDWVKPLDSARYEDDGFGGTVGILQVDEEKTR